MFNSMLKWERVGQKWRDLAERRHAHYLDLYKTGRWKRYYTEKEFRAELSAAIELAQRWAAIAPREDERAPPATSALAAPATTVKTDQARAA